MSCKRVCDRKVGKAGHCTNCGEPVKPPRRSWCSKKCVDEYLIRRDPGYARAEVKKRDKGVCAECGVDTVALRDELWRAWRDINQHSDAIWRQEALDRYRVLKEKRVAEGFTATRQTWWDMDHIKPVIEGGGECGLDNLRTLCQPCHKKATKALARRRAQKPTPLLENV